MKSRAEAADLSWDDLRIAVATAKTGSLSGASRRLGLSIATVGRRLDRLERAMGVRLFHRHSAGITPTAEARALLSHADGVADRINDLMRAASAGAQAAEGVVTVTTIEAVVTHVIAPRLAELRARYPRIDVVLRATNRIERLDRGRADIAVRLVRPNEDRVVGRKLGVEHQALYASKAYLARRGRPARPAKDLSGHDVVTFEGPWESLPETVWLTDRLGGTPPAVRVTSISAMAAVVQGGAAMGILPTLFETPDLERLTGVETIPSRDLWLVMHEDLRDTPPVRAVADFLGEVFQQALRAKKT